MNQLAEYQYGSGRTLVNLQGKYLQGFLLVWREAKAAEIVLPETDHPGYVSLEALLAHVWNASRSYIIWMCAKLELPDPEIESLPDLAIIEEEADRYLAHLIERWATPLADVDEERFGETYLSNWGQMFTVDSMLEHAVVHPILHRVQLEELIEEQR